jgi:hypothetical protein
MIELKQGDILEAGRDVNLEKEGKMAYCED